MYTATQIHKAQWDLIQAVIDAGAPTEALEAIGIAFLGFNKILDPNMPRIEECLGDLIKSKDAELSIDSIAELEKAGVRLP